MLKKLLTIAFVSLVLICIFGMWRYYVSQRPFVYAGTLETTKVIVSSKVSSDIIRFDFEEGDSLKKGDLVLEMSCDAYKVQQTQIDHDYERAKALLKKGHISDAQYDVINRDKQDNDLKLQWCRITSPIDGIIITKFRENGELVAPGSSLFSVADPYHIWAYFYVPHDDIYRLKVGQKVIGIIPEIDNKKFEGKIIKINEQAEFTPKNVQTRDERTRLVYGVKVKFDNSDLILKSGMTIESTLFDD